MAKKYIPVHLHKRPGKKGNYYYLRWRRAARQCWQTLGRCPWKWAIEQRGQLEEELNNPAKAGQVQDRDWDKAVEDYKQGLRLYMRREKTIGGYATSLAKLRKSTRGLRTVGDVKTRHIVAVLDAAKQANTPDNVNSHLRNLRAFFNWAVGQKIIAESPTKGIKQLPSNRKLGIAKPKLIPPAEIRKVVILAKGLFLKQPTYQNHRNYVFLEYLRYTGVRLMEAVYCDWADIDLRAEIIHIRPKPAEGWRIKTDTVRQIAVHPELLKALRNFRAAWPKRLPHLFHSTKAHDGRTTTRRWANGHLAVVKRLAKDAGVKYLNCHHFRHLFRSMLAEANAPAANIDAMLGHSDAETARRYTHPLDLKKTIRLLDYGS